MVALLHEEHTQMPLNLSSMSRPNTVDLSPTRVSVVSWLAINQHDSTEQGPDCFKRKLPVVTTYVLWRQLDWTTITLDWSRKSSSATFTRDYRLRILQKIINLSLLAKSGMALAGQTGPVPTPLLSVMFIEGIVQNIIKYFYNKNRGLWSQLDS